MVRLGRSPPPFPTDASGTSSTASDRSRRKKKKDARRLSEAISSGTVDGVNDIELLLTEAGPDETYPGRIVSHNLIQNVYGPMILERAQAQLEGYTLEVAAWEEAVLEIRETAEREAKEEKEKASERGEDISSSSEEIEKEEEVFEEEEEEVKKKEGEEEEDKLYQDDANGQESKLSLAELKKKYGPRTTRFEVDSSLLPPAPTPPAYHSQEAVDALHAVLLRSHIFYIHSYRRNADALKFDRLLDERYGRLRPLLTHPRAVEFSRYVRRRIDRGDWSFRRREGARFSISSSIVTIFLAKSYGVLPMGTPLVLVSMYCAGVNAWVVVFGVLMARYFKWRRRNDRQGMFPKGKQVACAPYFDPSASREEKHGELGVMVGDLVPDDPVKELNGVYDTMVVGFGIDVLYNAALLSRAGRKVLVVCPTECVSGVRNMSDSVLSKVQKKAGWNEIPFDIHENKIGKISTMQPLLSSALNSEHDVLGGIRFAQVGTEADGFAYDVINVPGMGTQSQNLGYENRDNHLAKGGGEEIPYVLRAGGIDAICEDATMYLDEGWNDDHTATSLSSFITIMERMNDSSTKFFVSKNMARRASAMLSMQKGTYSEAAARYAGDFYKKLLSHNAHVRSLVAALGLKNENLPPAEASMGAHISNLAAAAHPHGYWYPIGGPRPLCHALAAAVEGRGGKVLAGIPISRLVFREEQKGRLRCTGVALMGSDEEIEVGLTPNGSPGAVVSHLGLIRTFAKIPPEVHRIGGFPIGLASLTERRPTMVLTLGIKGDADELALPPADWWRLPHCALSADTVDTLTGQIKCGEIGGVGRVEDTGEEKEEEEETEEQEEVGKVYDVKGGLDGKKKGKPQSAPDKKKKLLNKYTSGSSWMRISFPSAKDPSWKERHPGVSTCK
mmetsp:Transcript_18302/g.41849  ORF Transcript_18302/g.41849 Transcript_18302/m.41849 type:complete len:899 (-) Transcript_18302:1265-3961(-)